jgi:hypothetical protein
MRARTLVSLAGPGAFAAASIVAGRRTPGYSARDEPISALAAQRSATGPLMVGGFLALAAGQAALARSLRGSCAAPSPIPTLVAAASATTAAAGLARVSARHCPSRFFGDDDATWVDEAHSVVSLVTFLLWITTPFVASTHAQQATRRYRRSSRAIGVAAFGAFIGGGLLARRPDGRWSGFGQRAFLVTVLAWYPVAAIEAER